MSGNRRVLRLELARTLPIIIPRTPKQKELAADIAGHAQAVGSSRGEESRSQSMAEIDLLVERLYGVSPTGPDSQEQK